jgi:hypothetical protein
MTSLFSIPITKKHASGFVVGVLLIAGLLGACTKVYVSVDSCPSGARVITEPPPIDGGVCRTPISIPAGTNAYGFWNTETMAKITDNNHTCGGFKCQATPGTCPDMVTPCKTWFKASAPGSHTGTCSCSCSAPQ